MVCERQDEQTTLQLGSVQHVQGSVVLVPNAYKQSSALALLRCWVLGPSSTPLPLSLTLEATAPCLTAATAAAAVKCLRAQHSAAWHNAGDQSLGREPCRVW